MTERWISARRAAEHLGYEPGDGPVRSDRAMQAFYKFVSRHRRRISTKKVGRLLRFKVSDLERAVEAFTAAGDDERAESRRDAMRRRAREDAAGARSA